VVAGWRRPAAAVTVEASAAPAAGPYWREVYKTPPDLDFVAGTWCRLCDGLLSLSSAGWVCDARSCRAAWDFQGRHGWWRLGGAR
jgi:hypothetical protein